jgi:hypothetical protein
MAGNPQRFSASSSFGFVPATAGRQDKLHQVAAATAPQFSAVITSGN